MTIEFRGAISGAATNTAVTLDLTALTGGSGSSVLNGDVVLLWVARSGVGDFSDQWAVTEDGWTNITRLYADDTRDVYGALFYKVCTTADTSVTVGLSGGQSTSYGTAAIAYVWGVCELFAEATTTNTGANAARPDSPSITTEKDDSVVVSFGAGTGDTSPQAFTEPSGYSNVVTQTSAGTSSGSSIGAASKLVSTAGAEDPGAWSGGESTTSDSWIAATVLLAPVYNEGYVAVPSPLSAPALLGEAERAGWLAVPGVLGSPTLLGEIPTTIFATATEEMLLAETPEFGLDVLSGDALALAESSSLNADYALLEALILQDTQLLTLATNGTSTEAITLGDAIAFAVKLFSAEGLSVADTSTLALYRILLASEIINISTANTALLATAGALLEQLTVAETAAFIYGFSAEEAANFAESVSSAVASRLRSADALALADVASRVMVAVVASTEVLALADTNTLTLRAVFSATDSFTFVGRLPLGDDDYQLWTLNVDNLGLTKYTNFLFNSFVAHGGKTYGINEVGIYELAGDTDADSDIAAYIKTGMLSFGSAFEKNIARAYLYLKSDQEVYLRVFSDERGSRNERWYSITANDTNTLEHKLVRLVSGAYAISWGIEVKNVDGGTLDLRGLEVVPALTRRLT